MLTPTGLKGNWIEQKGKFKQKLAKLTSDDLLFTIGEKEEMIGKLHIKQSKCNDELHKIMATRYFFLKNL